MLNPLISASVFQAELEGVYVNGNAFHDPLRLSVSVPAGVLREALADRDSSFCQNIKQNYKICVSGGGEWMYLDLLPKHGTDSLAFSCGN